MLAQLSVPNDVVARNRLNLNGDEAGGTWCSRESICGSSFWSVEFRVQKIAQSEKYTHTRLHTHTHRLQNASLPHTASLWTLISNSSCFTSHWRIHSAAKNIERIDFAQGDSITTPTTANSRLYLRLPASTCACKLCMSTANPLSCDGLNRLNTTEMCRICCLPPGVEAVPSAPVSAVPSLMPSRTAGTLCAGSMGIGRPCRP